LKAELQTELSVQALCTALKRLRLHVEKVLIAAARGRPDVAARREELRREQPLLNPDRLVLIDETWATTNMAQPRGWAARGERLLEVQVAPEERIRPDSRGPVVGRR